MASMRRIPPDRYVRKVRKMFARRLEVWSALDQRSLARPVASAADAIARSLRRGGKLLIFGNGGSAAEAQHFAAELVGRFEGDRRALPAISLTTDTSILTAQANDSGYDSVFSRQIEALANRGDVVVGMTTSDAYPGHSENIRQGFLSAKERGCVTIGFFSRKTTELLRLSDVSLAVPESNTALIQEVHLALIHIIAGLIEQELSARHSSS